MKTIIESVLLMLFVAFTLHGIFRMMIGVSEKKPVYPIDWWLPGILLGVYYLIHNY